MPGNPVFFIIDPKTDELVCMDSMMAHPFTYDTWALAQEAIDQHPNAGRRLVPVSSREVMCMSLEGSHRDRRYER